MNNKQTEKNKTSVDLKDNGQSQVIKKKFSGVVVSDKSDKTIVVRVDSIKVHPKYKKRYTSSKKYKVHDENNEYKVDEKVSFIECRPLSKDKRWRVIKK